MHMYGIFVESTLGNYILYSPMCLGLMLVTGTSLPASPSHHYCLQNCKKKQENCNSTIFIHSIDLLLYFLCVFHI